MSNDFTASGWTEIHFGSEQEPGCEPAQPRPMGGSLRSLRNRTLMRTVMLRIYTLSTCDSCRSALKWLRARGIPFKEVAIRETPPAMAELRSALAANGGELRRLFNTAGRAYRAEKLGEKLPALTPSAALMLLSQNGDLVKRPFLVGRKVALTGFNENAWSAALTPRDPSS